MTKSVCLKFDVDEDETQNAVMSPQDDFEEEVAQINFILHRN